MKRSEAERYRRHINTATAQLDDATALATIDIFEPWRVGVLYAAGARIRYNDKLYKCVQGHTSQADWMPDITPALWVIVSIEEWPDWVQPTGAHDAYAKGSKVSHNEKHWISDVDGNIWEPGVYGWTEEAPAQ